jgi:membrane peptidoglycan carboxypeptidase
MIKFIKYCFFSFLIFSMLTAMICAGGVYYLVTAVHGPEMEESYINDILGRESPVYYRDGQNKLGVLFEGIHRQYLTYTEIPKNFIDALIAAEDDQFFSHFGLDIPGIIRAMIVNIKAGKIVQGGSTITQQTAKNLFKRESRSLQSKLKELLFALRLERKYSKEKILEFYSNQFFVSGNGHGLGVAARYFFDKEPQELSLLECAFIAGSVKRPNYYNPFLKKNVMEGEQVKQRAKERINYVVGRMLKAGKVSEAEADNLKSSEIVFKQGKMAFAQNTAMDLVKEGLGAPAIAESLEENGISNVSTSGVHVITSLDKEIQGKAVFALRRQLSQLDVRLRGYPRALVQAEYKALEYPGDGEFTTTKFVFGTIQEISDTTEHGLKVRVLFNDGLVEGIVDNVGIGRLVESLAKFNRNASATAGPADRKGLLKELQTGDKIYVSIRSVDDKGKLLLDLERFPQVEGAAFVLQEGAIRGMSGGMSNLNFNRATNGKRLMGSTFKPFLFAAALQLGWSSVDMLNNSRDTFVFMNRPYSPQPDHASPYSAVSLSWAGVTSENVAAVWLLYHLTDHLTLPRIRELAAQLDMAPRVEGGMENYQRYKERIRDKFGIILSRELLEQAAFNSAVKALKPDFLFDDRTNEYNQLVRLKYDPDYLGLRSLLPSFLSLAFLQKYHDFETKEREEQVHDTKTEAHRRKQAPAVCFGRVELLMILPKRSEHPLRFKTAAFGHLAKAETGGSGWWCCLACSGRTGHNGPPLTGINRNKYLLDIRILQSQPVEGQIHGIDTVTDFFRIQQGLGNIGPCRQRPQRAADMEGALDHGLIGIIPRVDTHRIAALQAQGWLHVRGQHRHIAQKSCVAIIISRSGFPQEWIRKVHLC